MKLANSSEKSAKTKCSAQLIRVPQDQYFSKCTNISSASLVNILNSAMDSTTCATQSV